MQLNITNPTARNALSDRLEATLLAQVLKDAGPQPLSGPFGGGEGESQFASFMTEHLAAGMAARMDLRLVRGEHV